MGKHNKEQKQIPNLTQNKMKPLIHGLMPSTTQVLTRAFTSKRVKENHIKSQLKTLLPISFSTCDWRETSLFAWKLYQNSLCKGSRHRGVDLSNSIWFLHSTTASCKGERRSPRSLLQNILLCIEGVSRGIIPHCSVIEYCCSYTKR